MSRTPETRAQTLTYALSPGASGLSIDRRAESLHIEISAPRRRVRGVLAMMTILILAAGGFAYLWATAQKISEPVRVGIGIFGTAGAFRSFG